ncbi:MAG: type I DNA topoisomerase [Armatimonadetes bacterium]|nr:type I DNA topoisomerase [Armatimonadota bacterium]
MAKSLIIVESPAKTKTLKTFLGDRFDVRASMGHVRDLPKSQLGVDVEHGFQPKYISLRDRKETLKDLKSAASRADEVYLASDPDREGEAIAWHLAEELQLKDPKRIEFNEITQQAVQNALQHPRSIDYNRVNAQQARRILDRLVGYKLSPLLWKKVKGRLSAGRVQSVAVRLICDREREIQAFVPVEYWTITARLNPHDVERPFEARLIERRGEKVELPNEESVNDVLKALEGAEYRVLSVKKRQRQKNPAPPFITSTLQQEAARKLGFSAKRTMTVAQQLYEGIDLGKEGSVGLITYMRTDSTRIANEAQEAAVAFIEKQYGKEYLPEKPRTYKSGKAAQEAHEAIRPTSVFRTPDEMKPVLSNDQPRHYTLIWQRFVASQMAPARFDVTTVDIQAGECLFRASGSVMRFAGYTAVYTEGKDDPTATPEEEELRNQLPDLSEGELLRLIELLSRQHFTEPPPRFSEATLVKTLEELGIGRPSTYASIMGTIQERGYANLEEKRFHPTELGFVVTDQLVKFFPQIMNVEFTADVEHKLDDVEEGEENWVQLLEAFYGPFEDQLEEASEKMERVKIEPVMTDIPCPDCGRMMVERSGRFGPFLGCSGFPECRHIMPTPSQKLDVFCPKPDCPGEILEKRSKKGRVFYGCNQYPNCDFVSWNRPSQIEKCETCGYPMGEKVWRGRVTGKECTNRECPTVQAKTFANPLTDPDTEGPEVEGKANGNGASKAKPKAAASKTAAKTRATGSKAKASGTAKSGGGAKTTTRKTKTPSS